MSNTAPKEAESCPSMVSIGRPRQETYIPNRGNRKNAKAQQKYINTVWMGSTVSRGAEKCMKPARWAAPIMAITSISRMENSSRDELSIKMSRIIFFAYLAAAEEITSHCILINVTHAFLMALKPNRGQEADLRKT